MKQKSTILRHSNSHRLNDAPHLQELPNVSPKYSLRRQSTAMPPEPWLQRQGSLMIHQGRARVRTAAAVPLLHTQEYAESAATGKELQQVDPASPGIPPSRQTSSFFPDSSPASAGIHHSASVQTFQLPRTPAPAGINLKPITPSGYQRFALQHPPKHTRANRQRLPTYLQFENRLASLPLDTRVAFVPTILDDHTREFSNTDAAIYTSANQSRIVRTTSCSISNGNIS